MRCEECDSRAITSYCGFKKVTKENFDRAFNECKDLKYYCVNHGPGINSKPSITQIEELPHEFVQLIEKDLNKMIEIFPNFLEKNYEAVTKNQNHSHPSEFLTGWCMGICESGYLQAYLHDYEKLPSDVQMSEIREIIAKKGMQIEQVVLSFLKEKDKRHN